jgi:HrpA-like RNA helicase
VHECKKGNLDRFGNFFALAIPSFLHYMQEIAAARPELRVVVMSATLEAGNFRNYFNERSAELKLPGRSYPVTVSWSDSSPTADNYRELAVAKVKWVHQKEQRIPGDILLFLTGEEVGE